jgi:hypothetical protein
MQNDGMVGIPPLLNFDCRLPIEPKLGRAHCRFDGALAPYDLEDLGIGDGPG